MTEEKLLWVEDAMLTDPMQTTQASSLPGNPTAAYSTEAEQGTITFSFAVECAGEFEILGLVWDSDAGAQGGPDSFYVDVDGEPVDGFMWAYGCQTGGNPDGYWEWVGVDVWEASGCVTAPFSVPLVAGNHQITLRNREDAGFGENEVAAVAAIIVTSNQGTDPDALYDPHA